MTVFPRLVVAAAAVAVVPAALAAPCSSGELPYAAGGYRSATPEGACSTWGNAAGFPIGYYSTNANASVGMAVGMCTAVEEEGREPADIGQVYWACELMTPTPQPTPTPTPAPGTASPFVLTLAEGAAISLAILSVWASAFAVKAAAMALKSGDPE